MTDADAKAEVAHANATKTPPWGWTNCERCGADLYANAKPDRPVFVGPHHAWCFDCFMRLNLGRAS